jgi:gamma-butyrobetaine dioxygenase
VSRRSGADLQALMPFAAIWLRDNCRCARCLDPRSGQKLFVINDLPADISVGEVVESDRSISVTFEPEGHVSEFARSWLDEQRSNAELSGSGRTETEKHLWEAADLDGRVPVSDWSAYRDNPVERHRALRQVLDLGFVILRRTPTVDKTVLLVVESFGFVRETNYGRVFDVKVEADAANLAFTRMAIGPHTDNPYRDPVPTLQLLHCLSNAVEGGESNLIDGFCAASRLRAQDPVSFGVLTRSPVRFAWSDPHTVLRADRPIIELDATGRIREVHYNHRSMAPLFQWKRETIDFYAAYRQFAETIARPELAVRFKLEPGDCLLLDNTRLLHARTAFVGSGTRHLQGCYADLDALSSSVTLLDSAR